MKKFKILILTLFVLFLTSCSKKEDNINLNNEAVINLQVNTDAKDVEVYSSYGNVTKGIDNTFKITLNYIKEINVSVSAKGYITNSFMVTINDLKYGVFNKDVNLVDNQQLNIDLNFYNVDNNVIVKYDNSIIGESKNNKLSLKLDKEKLDKKIIIDGENIEPYELKLNNEQIQKNYLIYDVVLTKKNTKLFKLEGNRYYNYYCLKDNKEFMKINSVQSHYTYNKSFNFISLDKDFSGYLNFYESFNNTNNINYKVEKDCDVYGNVIALGGERERISYEVKNFKDNNNLRYYYNNNDKLEEISINRYQNSNWLPENIAEIYIYDIDNNNYNVVDVKDNIIDFNDQKPLGYEIEYCLYHDKLDILYDTTIKYEDEFGNAQYITTHNGCFNLPKETYYVVDMKTQNNIYLNSTYSLFRNGKLCKVLYNFPISYKNKIIPYYNGQPIKFDYIYNNYKLNDNFININCGNYSDSNKLIGRIGDEVYFAEYNTNYKEMLNDKNIYDEKEHCFMQKINFRKDNGFILELNFDNNFESGYYYDIISTKILNDSIEMNQINMRRYYLYLSDINEDLKFEFEIIKNKNNDYDQSFVRETFKLNITLNMKKYIIDHDNNIDNISLLINESGLVERDNRY